MMEKASPVRRLPILTAKATNPVKRSPGLADGKPLLTSKSPRNRCVETTVTLSKACGGDTV
jgi:hypothetical protein